MDEYDLNDLLEYVDELMPPKLHDEWEAEMRYAEEMAAEERQRQKKIDNCPHPGDYVRYYPYHSDLAGDDVVGLCELCEGVVD